MHFLWGFRNVSTRNNVFISFISQHASEGFLIYYTFHHFPPLSTTDNRALHTAHHQDQGFFGTLQHLRHVFDFARVSADFLGYSRDKQAETQGVLAGDFRGRCFLVLLLAECVRCGRGEIVPILAYMPIWPISGILAFLGSWKPGRRQI